MFKLIERFLRDFWWEAVEDGGVSPLSELGSCVKTFRSWGLVIGNLVLVDFYL